MNVNKQNFLICLSIALVLLISSKAVKSQDLSFDYTYEIEMLEATAPPKLSTFPSFKFPDEARKNGVEGTLKATMVLGEDGKVRDIVINQGLPNGVSEEITKEMQMLKFVPATKRGQPTPVKLHFNYIVTAIYDESDKDVTKPKIIEKPVPVYPESQRAEKWKDKVLVSVLFYADGTLKVMNVNSSMPKEFDKSAAEAAKNIKFQPAIHKKSKKPVSQSMMIEFTFKP